MQTGWKQSYAAGYTDSRGHYAGGSEIMHLVPHAGRLYAFNGYWMDAHYPRTLSAQVLRLDEPDGEWQVDLNTHSSGHSHMKGNILKSVAFSTDAAGRHVDKTLLVAAAQADIGPGERAVSVFVRDDASGVWEHEVIQRGPSAGIRRVPRGMMVYRDPDTEIDRIFLLVGDPGILSGVYDRQRNAILWSDAPEHPTDGSALPARPLGIAEANGYLYFSAGGKIFRRNNGARPSWSLAYEIPGVVNTDIGGIRGLTAIANPNGSGDSLIFVWTPDSKSEGRIKRLDGTGLDEHDEIALRELFVHRYPTDDHKPIYSLGGYNRFLPVRTSCSGETIHIVGFQQKLSGSDAIFAWHGYYRGAVYAIRHRDGSYTTGEVNGTWTPHRPTLIAPRTFALSPFADEEQVIYFGGFDSNFQPSTNMAWVFKADADAILQ